MTVTKMNLIEQVSSRLATNNRIVTNSHCSQLCHNIHLCASFRTVGHILSVMGTTFFFRCSSTFVNILLKILCRLTIYKNSTVLSLTASTFPPASCSSFCSNVDNHFGMVFKLSPPALPCRGLYRNVIIYS